MKLDGRVALVTGAASGIGASTAARFIDEGATVVGLDLAESPVDGLAGHELGSVTDEAFVRDAVARTAEQHGSLDIVVNAAGVAGGGPIHMLDQSEWDRVIGINLTGTMLVSKYAIGVMLNQQERVQSSIVNIASIEGLEGGEGGSAYNASKGGVVLLTKNMAMDYGRRNIRVNCICPGFIETPMMQGVLPPDGMPGVRDRFREHHQLGRFGRPDEVAACALFLASDDASFVSGSSLVVDGGFTAGHRTGVSELLGLA